ncbi:hypothetical protein DBR42_26420 [Pelomonas sp. HMWF004]|nr:hypothetical protein DBR42_26420 [Pelomonas sp. HMWF004]
MSGRQTLDLAFAGLQALLPPRLARVLAWLRSPAGTWVRIPAGLLCIVASAFWFLPVIGIEWLPLGLLLLAQDLPFLRKPVGHFVLALLDLGQRLLRWWQTLRR